MFNSKCAWWNMAWMNTRWLRLSQYKKNNIAQETA